MSCDGSVIPRNRINTVFDVHKKRFGRISESLQLKIVKDKKPPYLGSDVIIKCPRHHLYAMIELGNNDFEISVLKLAKRAMLPNIRQNARGYPKPRVKIKFRFEEEL